MPKKRLLIIGSSLCIGGVEKSLVALVNSYDYSLYQIDLMLVKPSGEFLQFVNKEVRIISAPDYFSWVTLPKNKISQSIFKLLFKPLFLFFFIKNILWGLLNHSMTHARQRMWMDVIKYLPQYSFQYDEVLDFTGQMRQFALDKVQAKVKSTWVHSDYRVFGLDCKLDELLLSRFDHIYCVSDTCKTIFDEIFPHLSCKSSVRLNIIDIDLIKSQCNGIGFKDDFKGVRLLDVTRIDSNKGLDLAVQVCRQLKNKGIIFKWYILGSDPLGYKKTLEKLIVDNDVEDCFILEGFTSNPYPYMKQCDIIVHFSRFEGRSVAIDEALALNKTILLTNYPTAKDQIVHGVNGYICDFDIDKLTEMLSLLINSVSKKHTL